jgi:hypothetical protein
MANSLSVSGRMSSTIVRDKHCVTPTGALLIEQKKAARLDLKLSYLIRMVLCILCRFVNANHGEYAAVQWHLSLRSHLSQMLGRDIPVLVLTDFNRSSTWWQKAHDSRSSDAWHICYYQAILSPRGNSEHRTLSLSVQHCGRHEKVEREWGFISSVVI